MNWRSRWFGATTITLLSSLTMATYYWGQNAGKKW
ncbi:MAG: hypothetical protein QOJ19_4038 [Acidimicrobiia bacterium]|jgi:hypothetical protein|nr:hypothetical protein [Acidimicrobiia bacterium]